MATPHIDAAAPAPPRSLPVLRRFGEMAPGFLALTLVVLLVAVGQRTGWRLSKFSHLIGHEQSSDPAWCAAHGVSEAICVECRKGVEPRVAEFGWCKLHGVHECPLCHPELAQLSSPPIVTEDDLRRTAAALDFASRTANNSRCQSHQRRIQLTSSQALNDIGIEVAPASQLSMTESISAAGEIGFDPAQVARISPRVSGALWRVEKRVGDQVKAGELLALVDSADVGKAKAEFQQALTNLHLKTQSLARRKPLGGQTIAGRVVQAAEAEALEAQVQVLATRQALINLGLPVRVTDFADSDPRVTAERMRFLGLSESERQTLAAHTPSNNLLPVRAPFDGEIIERENIPGEAVNTGTTLVVVANTQTMWLTLSVALENADRVRAGQRVRFRHEGHQDWDEGVVSFVGRAVDESTRTVPVIVELANADGSHVAGSFGKASIQLREEPNAVVVPSSAIHWEGDCHIVFVRDKHFERHDAPKVFHVRTVRPGVQNLALETPVTEVIAGLLPGEMVATTNSGIFRSELLKNNLGAG